MKKLILLYIGFQILFCFAAKAQFVPYSNDDSTLLLMHFDGDLSNSSMLSEDGSANGNGIAYSNSMLESFGQCLELDGSSFLTVPHNSNLNLNGDWTIEAWINIAAFNPDAPLIIVRKPGVNNDYFSNFTLELHPWWGNVFHAFFFTEEELRVNVIGLSPEINQWIHVAFIRDVSNSELRLIVHDQNWNELQSISNTFSDEIVLLNTNDLRIGEAFEGYIDELRISNVVRSFPPPKPDYFTNYDKFITKLTELTASADKAAELDAFWNDLIATGNFPFAIGTKVAFLYRGTANTVTWAGEFNEWNMNTDPGARQGVSNIWLLEKVFPSDARFEYKMVKNGSEWMADPYNPYPPVGEYGNSDLRMPDYEMGLSSTSNSLSGFYYSLGEGPSSSQNFSISGSNLNGSKVTVTAPSNYEISNDNSTFTSSIDISYTAPSLSATTIHVRLKAGLSSGNYEQSITVSDNGSASNISINISGEVSDDGMILLRSNSRFEFWGLSSEEAAADTLKKMLDNNYDRVANTLNIELTKKVKVFVYQDVDALHTGIGWPDAPDWVVGTAHGADRIDIVSPYNPDPSHNFDGICGIVIHEMVHCFVHTLANERHIPIWLNEGAASYLAAASHPDKIAGFCYNIDLNDGVILSLDELNVGQTFGEIGGYGFSASIVEFIIKKLGGTDVLSQFIASEGLDYSILGYENKQEFQNEWHQYLYINYSCNYSDLHAAFLAGEVDGIAPYSVNFSDYSIQGGTTITSWGWDFDNDGTIDSHSQNPTWTYNQPGTYSVSLTVSDGTNENTYTKNNYIVVLGSVDFDNLSYGTDNSLEVITWNIEFFPHNGNATVDYLSQIIPALDADIIAFQEVEDVNVFNQLVNRISGYDGYVATFDGSLNLAYIVKSDAIQVNAVYEIYTANEYSLPFPRRPYVMEYTYDGQDFVIINNHYKAMGDGILAPNDSYDEENRRWVATNLIKEYIDNNFPNDNVIVVGDLNDIITDESANNVFQSILDDTDNYAFADYDIAVGADINWSYPDYPSHIDHIIISNEIFDEFYSPNSTTQTIKIEEHFDDGWNDYTQNISDHRPVALKLFIDETLVFIKNFEDQNLTSGSWTAVNVTGAQTWTLPESTYGHNNSYCAKISGYDNGANENENWLISPAFSPNNYNTLNLSFWNTSAFSGPGLELYWTDNYSGDPQTATWTKIDNAQWHDGNINWDWTFSGILDLSNLTGTNVRIGFKYTSTTQNAAAWELDDISMSGTTSIGDVFNISASVNPANSGTIAGFGSYDNGDVALLSATPNTGYSFKNWSENGNVVSTNASYSFTVNSNRTLVANFNATSDYPTYFTDYDMFIAKLTELTSSADSALKLDAFWNDLIATGNFPFAIGSKVAFLYRGTANTVSWAGDFNEWDMNADQGVRLGVSNIWLLEKEFPSDARSGYKIVKNGSEWIADENNPYPLSAEWGNSDLRMPDYEIPPETVLRPSIPKGSLSENILKFSSNLNYTCQYRVYTPAGYNELSDLPVIYVTDGPGFADDLNGKMKIILDNLIYDESIEPVIAVFLDPRDPDNLSYNRRGDEYRNNINFLNYVTLELIPEIDAAYKTNASASARAIAGYSYGGYNAAFFCANASEYIKNTAILSPIMHPNPPDGGYSINEDMMAADLDDTKIYMSYGIFDTREIGYFNQLKQIFDQKEKEFEYDIVNDGHTFSNWSGVIGNALKYFFSKDQNNDNSIYSFSINGQVADINENEIHLTLSNNTELTNLLAVFEVDETAEVFIDDVLQQSGVTENDFTNDVVYSVIAENGEIATYTVIVETTNGKNDYSYAVKLFPNPFKESFFVNYNGKYQLEIFTINGKCVIKPMTCFQHTKISLNHIPPGSYLVRITASRCVETYLVQKVSR